MPQCLSWNDLDSFYFGDNVFSAFPRSVIYRHLHTVRVKIGNDVVRGGRLLSVLSRRRDLQKPNAMEVLSAFEGGAQIVGGVLELATGRRLGRRRAGFPHHRASPRLD